MTPPVTTQAARDAAREYARVYGACDIVAVEHAFAKAIAEERERSAQAVIDYCRRMNGAGKPASFLDAVEAIRGGEK